MTFIVYSKDGCPYCTKIAQVLQLAECKHVIYKLDRDYTRSEFYQKFGNGSTFPQVVCETGNIGGCTETIKFLREKKLV
jgi:glutaredoxin|tara:strand:- start:1762 stop:1998 length:237 start_codon:yes stop_codon:yes gene_type:complete